MRNQIQSDRGQMCGCDVTKWGVTVGGILSVFCGIALIFYTFILIVTELEEPNKGEEFSRIICNVRLAILILVSFVGGVAGILLFLGARKVNERKVEVSLILQSVVLALAVSEMLVGLLVEGGYELEYYDLALELLGITIFLPCLVITTIYFKRMV